MYFNMILIVADFVWSMFGYGVCCFFFFKQKTAYEIGTGDWSSDVCSSDLSPLYGRYENLSAQNLSIIHLSGYNT